jgi:hypothetical protein
VFAVTDTSMRRLTTGIRSEKLVVRRFRRCANVIECIKVQCKVVKNTTSLLSVIVLLIERHVSAYSEAIIRFNRC